MDETRDDPDPPSEGVDDADGGVRPAPQPRTAPAAPLPTAAEPPGHVARHASSQAPRRLSRRWFVAGAVALVAGGAAGVAYDFSRGRAASLTRRKLPVALRSALAEERVLLANARAARRGGAEDGLPPGTLEGMVRDHEAHLTALIAAAAGYATPAHASSTGPPAPSGSGGRDGLRRLEQRAARRTARRAEQLDGSTAALLASIAACEATHVELLS